MPIPNKIKYSTTPSDGTIKAGNFILGVTDGASYGPTSQTGFYQGLSPVISGYTVYQNKATLGPATFRPNNDTEFINLTRALGGNVTGVTDSLVYLNSQSGITVVNRDYENIITNGLVLNLDAGFTPSYPRSGTTIYDLGFSGRNATLINGPIYSSSNGESIDFDGIDDYLTFNPITFNNSEFTAEIFGVLPGPINLTNRRTLFGNDLSYEISEPTNILMRFNIVGSGTTFINIGNLSIKTGETFHHVLVKRSGNIYQSYQNGVLRTTISPPFLAANGATVTSATSLIHTYSNFGTLYGARNYNGKLFLSRLYNRALSSSEILQNYQAQFPRFLGENIVTNGLVLYFDAGYRLSYPTTGTTWYDVSGYNNNATLVNGPTFNSGNGGSIVFDGTDDYGLTSATTSVGNSNTVSAFVKLNGLQTNSTGAGLSGGTIYTPTANGVDNYIGISGNKLYLFATEIADVNNFGLLGTTSLDTSNSVWYYVTSVIDGNTATIYINGVLEATVTQPFVIASWSSNGYIGCRTPTQRLLNGSIANISIYQKALTQTEILQNFNAQKSRFGL